MSYREIAVERAQSWKELTFEEFKNLVFKEKFDDGVFIVDGDTPIKDLAELKKFFDARKRESETVVRNRVPELAIFTSGGYSVKWSDRMKRSLTFCVSDKFQPDQQNQVIQGMERAARAWERYADIEFHHDYSQDRLCYNSNNRVVFDVRPVDVGNVYWARSFYPNAPRNLRSLLIDESVWSLALSSSELDHILTHEIGHILGFRHEHVRPEAAACWEDSNWDGVTDYDGRSIMNHPQCSGMNEWSNALSIRDRNGAACVYGEAPGFNVDHTIVDVANCTEFIAKRREFTQENISIPPGSAKRYALDVLPMSRAIVKIDASGKDTDLYVNFGFEATENDHVCVSVGSSQEQLCDVRALRDQYSLHITVSSRATASGSTVVQLSVLHVN